MDGDDGKSKSSAAPKLSEEERKEFREIFNLVDKDQGGSISNDELGELMDTLGIRTTQEDIDLMIQEIDEDSNGEIDFDEFVAVMSRKVNASYTPKQVKGAFKIFEGVAPPGHISIKDLENALSSYGTEKLTPQQAKELVAQLEPDANGMINYVVSGTNCSCLRERLNVSFRSRES